MIYDAVPKCKFPRVRECMNDGGYVSADRLAFRAWGALAAGAFEIFPDFGIGYGCRIDVWNVWHVIFRFGFWVSGLVFRIVSGFGKRETPDAGL